MKKVIAVLSILLLFGCTNTTTNEPNNVEEPTGDNPTNDVVEVSKLVKGTYKDVNNTYEGASLDTITLEEGNKALERSCNPNGGCTDYRGTYSINDNYLYISLTTYEDNNGNWHEIERDSDAPMEFEIVDNKTFQSGNKKYVFIFD